MNKFEQNRQRIEKLIPAVGERWEQTFADGSAVAGTIAAKRDDGFDVTTDDGGKITVSCGDVVKESV